MFRGISRAYFGRVGHAYSLNKKEHLLENLEQFKDETPLNSMQISGFWSMKMLTKIKKGHCVRVPNSVSV